MSELSSVNKIKSLTQQIESITGKSHSDLTIAIQALKDGYESADLIYHLIVLLTSKGYRIEDLARELKERHSSTWKRH